MLIVELGITIPFHEVRPACASPRQALRQPQQQHIPSYSSLFLTLDLSVRFLLKGLTYESLKRFLVPGNVPLFNIQ